MLKKTLIQTVLLLLVAITLLLLVIAPYHVYTLTLTEGLSTSFLEMKPSKKSFYDSEELFLKDKKNTAYGDTNLYTVFHFSNFQMPLPFNHPIFSLIPIIKIESTGPRLGASFLDGKNTELCSFMVEKNYRLDTSYGNQKLFELPIFKNYISKKSEEDIWNDLFSKQLSLPSNMGKSFYSSLIALKKVSYKDLVYNLFILFNRNHLFQEDILGFSFNPSNKTGMIRLPSDDPKFRVERLFILDTGIVYSITLRTRIDNVFAEHFREKVLKEITYKGTSTDSAIQIYAQYKNISYNNRIDQQGMTSLFVAWSHDISNRDYIRVIILFLERGKSNLKYLQPFYEYAFKKFGSSLSSENDLLIETAVEKLKRNMKVELENEVTKEENLKNVSFEGKFNSPAEKVKFYLQKAKDKKINSDDSEKVLIQE